MPDIVFPILRFWEYPLTLYFYAAVPASILLLLNIEDDLFFKSLESYKKYLTIHNWTLLIIINITIFTVLYHYFKYF